MKFNDLCMLLYETFGDFIVIVILIEYHFVLLLSEGEYFLERNPFAQGG